MIKPYFKFILLFFAVWGLTACNLADRIQASAIATIDPGSVLYFDDFSDPTSGWSTWEENGAQIRYSQDALRITVNDPHYDYWSLPGERFTDSALAVEAEFLGGPDDNDYGIICRYQDEYNFYGFLISSDGYAGIIKVKDGLYTVLNSENGLEYAPMIHIGEARNHLRADCVGNRLVFYINQEKFVEVNDTSFTAGEVGLIAGSYDKPGVDIQFDNFFVLKP